MDYNHELYDKVIKMNYTKSNFVDYNKDAIYIKPILKCNVKYLERTKANHLRQPIIKKV